MEAKSFQTNLSSRLSDGVVMKPENVHNENTYISLHQQMTGNRKVETTHLISKRSQ